MQHSKCLRWGDRTLVGTEQQPEKAAINAVDNPFVGLAALVRKLAAVSSPDRLLNFFFQHLQWHCFAVNVDVRGPTGGNGKDVSSGKGHDERAVGKLLSHTPIYSRASILVKRRHQ